MKNLASISLFVIAACLAVNTINSAGMMSSDGKSGVAVEQERGVADPLSMSVKTESPAEEIVTEERPLGDIYDLSDLENRAESKKHSMVDDLKKEAGARIFNHAVENASWFANEFYARRGERDYILEQMETYLIRQKSVDDFLIIAVRSVDREINRLAVEYFKDDNLKMKHNVDTGKILKANIPDAAAMVRQVYIQIEKTGVNSPYKSYLVNLYQKYRNSSKNTVMSMEAFVVVGSLLLSSNVVVKIVVSGAAAAIFGALEAKYLLDVKRYESEIINGIGSARSDFESSLENTAAKIVAAFISELKNAKVTVRRKL